jgi:integrase
MLCRALDEPLARRLAIVARARGDRMGAAVLLGLYAGLRRAEIARLRWSEIGTDGWLTIVGKGDVTRTIPLHPVVLEALRGLGREGLLAPEAPQRPEWVFPSPYGGPVHPTTVWTWVQQVGRDAGLELATHVLRHTCLATALDATRDLRAVQELAGHARPETTAGYTRVRRRRLEAVVAALEYEAS